MHPPHRRIKTPSGGLTLIELLVALAIGSFLVLGSINLLIHARATFAINESIARLQENARFALDTLESDLLLAGYLGPVSGVLAEHDAMLVPVSDPADIAIGNDCGPDWTMSLQRSLEATNNRYGLACAPYRNRSQPGSDTLVIRRAAFSPVTMRTAGTLYIASAPFLQPVAFVGSTLPSSVNAASTQVHPLIVNGYYASPTSTLTDGPHDVPSLRMKTLQGGASGPRIFDQEVMPGVEDLQIEFGIDTDVPGTPGHGTINRYVNPGDSVADPSAGSTADVRIVAVRVWIRVRAEQPEPGYIDTTSYRYADRNLSPPNDAYRRLLASRTIHLRNPVRLR